MIKRSGLNWVNQFVFSLLIIVSLTSKSQAMDLEVLQYENRPLVGRDSAATEIGIPENQREAMPYRGEFYKFDIISQGNCTRMEDGTLKSCVFPDIRIEEVSLRLPPLPFETIIRVKTSYECAFTGMSASLKVQLQKYGDGLGNDFAESLPNFKLEEININHTRNVRYVDTNNTPFKGIKIEPIYGPIFSQSVFSKGCEVSLNVEFNRISLKSFNEAESYLRKLRKQFEVIRGYHDSLLGILQARNERHEVGRTLVALQDKWRRDRKIIQNLQMNWGGVKQVLPELIESIEDKLGADENAFDIIDSIQAYDRMVDRYQAIGDITPELASQLNAQQQDDITNTTENINRLLEKESMETIVRKAKDAELQMRIAEESLRACFSNEDLQPRMMCNVNDELTDLISGPGGYCDRLIHSLCNIQIESE